MSSESDVINVVSGIPRSGTSLAMQMVAAAGIEPLVDAARPPDASNPRGYFELEAVKRMPRLGADWIAEARGRSVKVIHALLEFLPRGEAYRVVYMERDLDEMIASQDRMLERVGEDAGGMARDRLSAVLEKQSTAAKELLEANDCFEWRRYSHHGLLNDPGAIAADMADFLGRPDAARKMAACVQPELYRERA